MSGFFGSVSKSDCVYDVFYGTDYNSHMGKFALAIVGKISNYQELEKRALKQCRHFSEMSGAGINQTELVAMLIAEEETFVEGIKNVFERIKGSCSMLILIEDGIIAARDKLGRTPIIVGRKKDAWAVTSESIAFPNLGYEFEHNLGPGEIMHITPEGIKQLAPPREKMQICAFLWVYYGYPASVYEDVN